MELSIEQLVELTAAEPSTSIDPEWASNISLTGFADLGSAEPTDISFFANPAYLGALRSTRAGAVLVPSDFDEALSNTALLRVANPSMAFAAVVDRFRPEDPEVVPGIDPAASVHPTARVDAESVVVSPGAVIEEGASVGEGSFIGPNVNIGRHARVGAHCRLDANVVVRQHCIVGNRVILNSGVVIGSDGFGFEFVRGRHEKIKQVGIVQVDDDVEVGANTTIDRARFGKTWIQEGTKIDNLVQIGHNVRVGKHCVIVAQCAIAGSAVIGDYVVMAAQGGIAGHVHVGDQVTLAARVGVTKSMPGGQTYAGFPAQLAREERKHVARQRRLERLFERVQALEQALVEDKT